LQYKLFAELIEHALNHGVKLPDPQPHSAPVSEKNYLVSDIALSLVFDKTSDSSSRYAPPVCLVGLMHAGFYYLMAARCSFIRLRTFNEYLIRKDSYNKTPMAHMIEEGEREKNIDVLSLVMDLLTKAYEQCKKQKSTRLNLMIARDIANANQMCKKHDLALKYVCDIIEFLHSTIDYTKE